MGRQLIEHLARDMKLEVVVKGGPVRVMRGHLRLELSTPMAFWWRLLMSRRGADSPTDEDFDEVRRGFGIPEDVEPIVTQYGEHVLEWEVR